MSKTRDLQLRHPIWIFPILFSLAVAVIAFPTGAPPQRTGGFGESTCLVCHSDYPLNSPGGRVTLSGLPDLYVPGTAYTITVTVEHPSARRWGFEAAVRFIDTQAQAGQLQVTDAVNTKIVVANQVQYITHTLDGSRAGLAGPTTYSFQWQAPLAPGSPVRFNVAANAANNNQDTSGDYIYTASKDSTPNQAGTTVTTSTVVSTTSASTTTTTAQSTTTTSFPPATLVLPYKSYFTQLANRTSRRTGFALLNQNELPGTLRLTGYDNNGNQLRSAGGAFTNPVILPVISGSQLARVVSESDIFNVGLGNANGWILAEFDRPGLAGFYLLFNDTLTIMDGTDISDRLYSQMILPEVQGAEIALVNPGSGSATATINLVSDRGAQVGRTATVNLAARGRYAGAVTGLFTAADVAAAGYISVSATSPLAASELWGATDATLMALNPLDPAAGGKLLYSPQYVVGGGVYQTVLVLLNLEDAATQVELSLWGEKGSPLGRAATLDLPAKGRAVFSNANLLGIDPAGPLVEGYLRIRSSITRIDGYVRFGDTRNTQFQTALPLVSQGRDRLIYSQVAQNDLFFTGLAVVNPHAEPVDLFLSLFNTDGLRVGVGSVSVAPGGRISRLLTDLVPGMQPMSRGYFKVLASRPVFSFGVFGTKDFTVLSAIPPQ